VTGRVRALVLATAMTGAKAASAEPAARFVYLRGHDTDGCPAESDVRVAVQTRLGYDPFSTYAASTMFVEVTRDASGYAANLKLVDAESSVKGDRTLHVQGRCAELMDAMALTISIAIDPMSVTRNGPPPDAPPQEKPVDATTSPIETPLPPPPEPAREQPSTASATAPPLQIFAMLGPVASLGAAPTLAIGGLVGADAKLGRFVFGIEGRADLPASAESDAVAGVHVKSSLLAGSLFGGMREGPFFAAAVASVGRFAATANGSLATERERDALFLAAGLRVGAALELSKRFEARMWAEALANLQRHTLTVSGQTAYEYPIASGTLAVSVAYRFQ
jgi:hypothetical protein